MDEPIRCLGCSRAIEDDQTVVRMSAGVGTERGEFSGLLMRPDVYLHAGRPSLGPWGDEPNGERWCATPVNLKRAVWELRVDATTGGSGTYRGD